MEVTDGLINLWQNTGIYNLILKPDPSLSGVEQFLHVFGHPIMLLICLFLLWLGIKKQYEPLLMVPIAFGGILSNIAFLDPNEAIAGPNGFLGIIFNFGIRSFVQKKGKKYSGVVKKWEAMGIC